MKGYEVLGWLETTLLRGKVMVDRGQFFGADRGEWFAPRIDHATRSGPAC